MPRSQPLNPFDRMKAWTILYVLMASPFPGMDPYLEQSAYWSSFHTKLIAEFARVVSSMLPTDYYVEIGSQTAISPAPVEIKQRYVEVREMGSNAVITVIELLSPVNKRAGKGRDAYEEKRLSVLGSASHFVEIDLLRSYPSMPISTSTAPSDYYVLVSDAQQRPRASLYGFSIRETLPDFLLPLKGADEAIAVDLQQIFNNVYDQSRYINRIDYSKPVPAPALSAEDSNWADSILQPFRR